MTAANQHSIDHDVELLVIEILAECRERGVDRASAVASVRRALKALA